MKRRMPVSFSPIHPIPTSPEAKPVDAIQLASLKALEQENRTLRLEKQNQEFFQEQYLHYQKRCAELHATLAGKEEQSQKAIADLSQANREAQDELQQETQAKEAAWVELQQLQEQKHQLEADLIQAGKNYQSLQRAYGNLYTKKARIKGPQALFG